METYKLSKNSEYSSLKKFSKWHAPTERQLNEIRKTIHEQNEKSIKERKPLSKQTYKPDKS